MLHKKLYFFELLVNVFAALHLDAAWRELLKASEDFIYPSTCCYFSAVSLPCSCFINSAVLEPLMPTAQFGGWLYLLRTISFSTFTVLESIICVTQSEAVASSTLLICLYGEMSCSRVFLRMMILGRGRNKNHLKYVNI